MSTKERGHAALGHILQAIADYRVAVGDLDLEALILDRTRYYAAERLVEIISEASRRIPQEWKNEFPNVPWRDIAAVGNVLRHTTRSWTIRSFTTCEANR